MHQSSMANTILMKEVILIGGVGSPNEFVGGELTKNKNLLAALKNRGRKVYVVDTYGSRRKPWRLIPIPFVLLFHPRTNVLLSTSLVNIFWLIKWFSIVKTKRKVSLIGVGGVFSQWILEGKYDARYLKFLHKIAVQGQKMIDELAQAGLNQGYLLPNSKIIDYLPDLSKIKTNSGRTQFVFMSRMHEEKGVEMILDCAKRLNSEGYGDRFNVDYYGQFEDNTYKQKFLEKLAVVPNACFKGVVNLRTNEGYDELAGHDVMLFPSYWRGEGFPGIVIDALIAGLPIIISDWNFNADYVEEGVTGFVIKTKDQEALYQKMLDAICNREKYTQLAPICQSRAMSYDTRNVINEAFFEEMGV